MTFGFNNWHESWDMEWFAEHSTFVNSSQGFIDVPIAGPLGTYRLGYIHAPGTEPLATERTTFGRIKQLYGEGH